MGCQNPEPVMLSSESLHRCALGQIPDPDALVLRVGHYHILTQASTQMLSAASRQQI